MSGISSPALRGMVALSLLLVGAAPARGQSSSRTGGLPSSAMQRLDVSRPTERAQLMESRNAELLGTGIVDPDRYVLGPGDLVGLEILGPYTLSAEDIIGPDGTVTFPQIGTLNIGGQTLSQAQSTLETRATGRIRDTRPRLLLKTMRTFKVHVVGRVLQPGSYPATATTRVSELIQMARGLKPLANFRRMELLHTDGEAEAADLMPFLLGGRMEGNPELRDGDVLNVPPPTDNLEFKGSVLHPGIYPHVPGDELGALMQLVRLHPRADSTRAVIQRYSGPSTWDTLSVDLNALRAGVTRVPLEPGDRILIRAVGDWHTNAVAQVLGAVRFPGPVPIVRGEVSVGEAIRLAGGFLDDAVPSRIILGRPFIPDTTGVRDPSPTRNYLQSVTTQRVHELVVDLSTGDGPVVDPGDMITVPRREGWIEVTGQVRKPGFYDYRDDWRVSDYIEAAGGYGTMADGGKTRLSRGRYGDIGYAKDVDRPRPGDLIWVPERPPHTFWGFVKDFVSVGSQAVALMLVVREAIR